MCLEAAEEPFQLVKELDIYADSHPPCFWKYVFLQFYALASDLVKLKVTFRDHLSVFLLILCDLKQHYVTCD